LSGTGRNADYENSGTVGGPHQLLRLGNDGTPGDDRDTRKPRARGTLDRSWSDRWQIEAAVLSRLRRFYQYASAARCPNAAVRAHFGHTREHGIGSFGGLDRQDMEARHNHSLPDIKPSGGA
jgi:hypothetical protein